MGYETKLLVVQVYPRLSSEEVSTCGVIAEIDLSKAGHTTRTGLTLSVARDAAKTDPSMRYGFYSHDGNTVIAGDRYGAPVSSVPLEPLIRALEADWREDGYRRFDLALRLLSGLVLDPSWKHEIESGAVKVLQFGY